MANFGQLYPQVRQRAGLSTNEDTLAKQLLNEAAHDFYTARLWSFLQSTKDVTLTASTQEYTLAGTSAVLNDYASLISIGCNLAPGGTGFRKLKEIDQQLFDDMFGLNTETGIPAAYTVRGGTPATGPGATIVGGNVKLAFFPIPNGALTARVRYYRAGDTVEMSADVDTPLCPVRWQAHLVTLAAAKACEYDGGDDRAKSAKSLRAAYEMGLQRAIAEDIAARGTDDEQLERRQVIRVQTTAPLTPASFDPATRPYPKPAA